VFSGETFVSKDEFESNIAGSKRKTALDIATGSTWQMLVTVASPATIDTTAPFDEKTGSIRFNNDGMTSFDNPSSTSGISQDGFIQASALEASNVDLSRALTQLIIIQRGFQANGKTITTSDTLLETLIGLKR